MKIKSTNKVIVLLALLMTFTVGCSKSSSGGSTGAPPNTSLSSGDEGGGGRVQTPGLTKEEEKIATAKDSLEDFFPDVDIEEVLGTDDEAVADSGGLPFDSDTISALLADHFDLDSGVVDAITSLNNEDGSEMTTEQLMDLLNQAYPDQDLNSMFDFDFSSITGGGTDGGSSGGTSDILAALTDGGGSSSLLDIFTGGFGGN